MTARACPALDAPRPPTSTPARPARTGRHPRPARPARPAIRRLTRGPADRGPADRGAAAVELALVTPLLVLMLFGIIDFGRMMHAQITLTEAAREGARAAALHQPVEPRLDAVAGGLDPVTPEIAGCAGAGPAAEATVRLTHEFRPITPLGAITRLFGGAESGAVTITAIGVMPCLG